MKRRFRLSQTAKCDLNTIHVYVAEVSNNRAADRLVTRIIHEIHKMSPFPQSGRSCDHLGPGVRRLVYGEHNIYCQVRLGVFVVLRVLHGRTKQPKVFRAPN